jgi:hypothetical protein
MNHEQAVEEMATERYLLDELSPELRDAFEEHMFECQECALDVRAASVFLTEAKAQLPELTAPAAPQAGRVTLGPASARAKKPWWSVFAMPAFALPALAALLAVIAFQNVSTIPSLESALRQPRIIPWSSLHAGTRGTEATVVEADRRQGALVLIDVPQGYASFDLDLYDPQGKRLWTTTVSSPASGTLPLVIPGAGLQEGSYSLNLTGISPQGARTELGRRVLDVHFKQ